jgi:L-iditol 2-dehydrogenase
VLRAAIITGKGSVEVRDVSIPEIGPMELLIKMRACGICGTDLEKMHGDHITPPILGHEVAGVVEATGAGISDFSVGDRVAVHHHISCGHCYFCKNGFETLCEDYPKSNLDPCGFAELFRVPEPLVRGGTVYRLPDSVSFEEGSQAEPFACCIRALNKIGMKSGSTVAIYGMGPVGLSHLQLLKCFGATRVYAMEVIKKRREWALRLGADLGFDPNTDDAAKTISLLTGGLGVDLAIVATANLNALKSAFDTVRKGGRVLLFGAPTRGSLLTLDVSMMFLREVRFQSSYSTSETEMQTALELITSKRIKPSETITHRLPLSRTVEALGLADRATEAIKVIVENE